MNISITETIRTRTTKFAENMHFYCTQLKLTLEFDNNNVIIINDVLCFIMYQYRFIQLFINPVESISIADY